MEQNKERVIEIILRKLYSLKQYGGSATPVFAILDKKTYKQLCKEAGKDYRERYLAVVFNLKIKIVKSKEQIIFVGI